jgi:hypothetical protein
MDRTRIALVITLISFIAAAYGSARAGDPGAWDVPALWKPGNPLFTEKGSRVFESEGPILRSIRVSKRALRPGETCEMVRAKIKTRPIGTPFAFGKEGRWSGWGSWDDDLDAVESCDEFPCKIKFNEAETNAVAAKPKEGRLVETLLQVEKRIAEYEKTFRRRGYDLIEDAIDPWKIYPAKGHVLPAGFDRAKPRFFVRKLKFGAGNYRPLRQVFDERLFEEKARLVRVSRDVYTSHYFDGWGEWLEVRCSPENKEVLLLQDLLMEFDLLKNTDFFSVIARPKMRQGVDQESLKYQKAQAEKLFAP